MKNSKGINLVELMIVMAIMGATVPWIGYLFSSFSKTTAQSISKSQLAGELLASTQLLRSFMGTATDLSATIASGSIVEQGKLINGQGAVVIRLDARELTNNCPNFTPATTLLPANLATAAISCCDPRRPFILAARPRSTAALRVNNACGANWGLTVITYRPNGTVFSTRCIRGITDFSVFINGVDSIKGISPIYTFDLAGQTSLDASGKPSQQQKVRATYTSPLGNPFVSSTSGQNYSTSPFLSCGPGQF